MMDQTEIVTKLTPWDELYLMMNDNKPDNWTLRLSESGYIMLQAIHVKGYDSKMFIGTMPEVIAQVKSYLRNGET